MSDYVPPLADIKFILDHLTPLDELAKLEPYQQIDAESVEGVIEEFGRLMAEVWAPTNRVGDEQGSHVEGDSVVTPPGFKEAYGAYAEAGWGAVPFEEAYGGGGFRGWWASSCRRC
ncbi:MAG: acyl-CoA dehydrogenase N-terminal domain-containing protein [Acidimicrobiales bacterium]